MENDEPFLDFYEVDDGTRWNWKYPDERLVSQEFLSEAEAVEAWRNNQLVWESPPESG